MMKNLIADQQLGQLLRQLQLDPRNEDLWRSLYQKIRRFVYAVSFRVLNGNAELARDATQVVFIRLFEYCEFTEFSDPGDFLGYVGVIARHAALDLIKREKKYVTGLDLTLCDFLPGTPTPAQHERARSRLHDVLEQLDSEEKRIVNMLMQGWTLEEVAQGMGVSYANAAVRIHRLRERLRMSFK
jgi:RNA polymerase sigma factor (sigma-70 family)